MIMHIGIIIFLADDVIIVITIILPLVNVIIALIKGIMMMLDPNEDGRKKPLNVENLLQQHSPKIKKENQEGPKQSVEPSRHAKSTIRCYQHQQC